VPNDSLRADVEAIARPEGRMVGSPGHARARGYLERRLGEAGLAPYRGETFALSYRHSRAGLESHNLVGVIPGTDRRLPPLIIGAHYDSIIAAPSADDNAAAVAIALSAAAALGATARPRDVVIALFDAEEPPYFLGPDMGSVRFCASQVDARGVHAALVMDLVGHDFALPLPGLANLLVAVGIESSGALPTLVDACPRPAALPLVVARNDVVGDMSDHHAFRQRGVPYLFLTCGRWTHYHRESDTPDRLAWNKMALIRDYLVALAGAMAHGALAVPPVDTTAMEIRYLEAALGPVLPVVLARLGIRALKTREDLKRLAFGLQALGV
jgi:Peptidase family M28